MPKQLIRQKAQDQIQRASVEAEKRQEWDCYSVLYARRNGLLWWDLQCDPYSWRRYPDGVNVKQLLILEPGMDGGDEADWWAQVIEEEISHIPLGYFDDEEATVDADADPYVASCL